MSPLSDPVPDQPAPPVHLSGYQARDHEIVDYRMYDLPGTGLRFRGPPPPELEAGVPAQGSYFACLGAGQTFGCFCADPWPDLLSRRLGLPALNLGYGGAGPEFYLRQTALMPWINGARFVVLQVMSARSQSNSLYDCGGLEYVSLRGTGERMGAAAAFGRVLKGPWPHGGRAGRKLSALIGRPRARALVAEARAAWEESMRLLIARIEVPVVLFWFSKRGPDYHEDYGSARKLFGEFPHLVTSGMLESGKARAAAYVEAVSSRGSPQPLVSRFTGQPVTVLTSDDRADLARKPWSENHYYPSPEMHEDGAEALLAPCRALLDRGLGTPRAETAWRQA